MRDGRVESMEKRSNDRGHTMAACHPIRKSGLVRGRDSDEKATRTGLETMKMKLALVLMLFSIEGPALAQVNALPPTRHILVFGEAQARAIPDRFKIEIGLESVDPKADTARRKVEANVRDVLAKLERAGAPTNEIVATSLDIEPRNEYDQTLREQVFKGIAVSRRITVRFNDHAKLETFLASLETSKEVKVSGVTTELGDEPALMNALRGKAIESTRRKADVIAKSYGVRLAGVYSVSDVAPEHRYGIAEGDWPSTFIWRRNDDGGTTLDRIEVTGSRIDASELESFRTGYVTFEDRIYAVFLISD